MARVVYTEPSCDQYFPTQTHDVQDSVQSYVTDMGEMLKQANNFEDEYTYNLSKPEIEEVLIYGRLYSSSVGDIESTFSIKNCILSLPTQFSRKEVNLLFKPTVKGLFRGQIIAVSGKYSSGNVYVSDVFTNCRVSPPKEISEGFSTTIAVASGPFADKSFEEAKEANAKLRKISAEKTIFLGPICTCDSSLLNDTSAEGPADTPDTLSEELIKTLSEDMDECVFVSSPDDAAGLPVLPSPRIFDSGDNYFCTGNPCQLQIGELSLYAFAYCALDKVEEQCDGAVEPSCLAQQCSGLPAVAHEMIPNNIESFKAKRSPHIYIVTGKEAILEWEGTKTVAVPNWITSKKVAVIRVAGGSYNVEFV
jgi:hypothetical protein